MKEKREREKLDSGIRKDDPRFLQKGKEGKDDYYVLSTFVPVEKQVKSKWQEEEEEEEASGGARS